MAKLYHNSFFAMGTRLNIILDCSDEELCETLVFKIKNEIERIENKFSYFNSYSVISTINQYAYHQDVKIDDETYGLLYTCLEFNKKTFCAFDITMRTFMEDDADYLDTQTNYSQYIMLNSLSKTVRLKEKVKIEIGAIGKGYALQKISKLINNYDIQNVLISFGESSIIIKGNHPLGNNWKIGINNLLDNGKDIYVFEKKYGSISTSSNYHINQKGELAYKKNIINPDTKKECKDVVSVSVYSKSPILSEIFSTACLVLDDNKIKEIKSEFYDIEIVKIFYYDKTSKVMFF